jgi:O-acetyl-ADP-ribose deacetylase (regulator of RNase III)
MGIQSIAFPKLGCGHGNLSWAEVGPLMVNYLSPLTCKVTLHIDEGDTTYSTMG